MHSGQVTARKTHLRSQLTTALASGVTTTVADCVNPRPAPVFCCEIGSRPVTRLARTERTSSRRSGRPGVLGQSSSEGPRLQSRSPPIPRLGTVLPLLAGRRLVLDRIETHRRAPSCWDLAEPSRVVGFEAGFAGAYSPLLTAAMVPLSLVALVGRTELVFRATRPPQTALRSQAHTRQGSVATEDSACDRRAPLARRRVPPVASGQPCRSARRSCRGQAGAPPAAWHALGAAAAHPQRRQVAPRRAVSAPCHRAGAPGAPCCATGAAAPAARRRTAARESRAGLTRCDGGKSHPPKGTTQPHQCKGQRSGKGTFFLVRALWVRLGIRLQQVMPAIPPCAGTRSQPTDRHHRAAALLYFAAVQGS